MSSPPEPSPRLLQAIDGHDPVVAAILNAAVDAVVIADRHGIVRAANRACCTLFGFAEGELVGRNVTVLMPAPFSRDHDRHLDTYRQTQKPRIIGVGRESLGRRQDGAVFPIHITVGEARLDGEVAFVGIIRDMSDRVAAEQRATYLAQHDPLTGVLTRGAFLEECETALAALPQDLSGGRAAYFAIDIDRFADINEAYGFHVGDAVLKAMVARIAEVMPKNTSVCRIAADEFAVLVRVGDPDHARTLARVLHDRLIAAIHADRRWVQLGVSLGASVSEAGATSVEELGARAKMALQTVRHGGGNAVGFHTVEMAGEAARRARLTAHLVRAIERHELHLAFQPVVRHADGTVMAAESMLRWTHETLGDVAPEEFLPVAEDSGVIVPITEWMLAAVVQRMAEWEAAGILPERVSVTVAGRPFLHGALIQRLAELLAPHPGLRGRLGLGLTERAAVRDLSAAAKAVRALAAIAVPVALDAYGADAVTPRDVQLLGVGGIRLDRALVGGVPGNTADTALVRAAVGLAHGLGLPVIADGVVSAEQAGFLAGIGCELMQGSRFGAPMPAEAFAAFLKS